MTSGPFRYGVHADSYFKATRAYTKRPVKQAVISASALSLLYPAKEISGYSRASFIADLIDEVEVDIRGALNAGAASVQIDFTEGRLSLKLDPSGTLLRSFVELNNQVLGRFTPDERRKIGVHVCPGGDRDSTHSADVDYAGLLPDLFRLNVGRFYIQMASEPARKRVLRLVDQLANPQHLANLSPVQLQSVLLHSQALAHRVRSGLGIGRTRFRLTTAGHGPIGGISGLGSIFQVSGVKAQGKSPSPSIAQGRSMRANWVSSRRRFAPFSKVNDRSGFTFSTSIPRSIRPRSMKLGSQLLLRQWAEAERTSPTASAG